MNGESIAVVSNVIQTRDTSIWGVIASADLVGKGIIFILIFLSIMCWAIIIEKMIKFRNVGGRIVKFDQNFWSGQPLEQLYEAVRRNVDNPLASVFISAMNEIRKTGNKGITLDSSFKAGQKDRVMHAMNLVRNRETESLEKHLGFLGSVGGYSPFIGLLGMVWGVMRSFQSVASAKSFNITVLAGGISEALFVTAVGLFAAIPAIIAYNYLSTKLNTICNRIDDFIVELYNIVSRGIDEERM